ncbi:MAG: carboxypeptidase regulatory-like domain-containing protein [Candidatus Lokiarchaeota archaeon]|nr:carboxypeptidase regulatory-like domain-containing protein [Candidatus Lokiarchaeota archaeon]
MPSKKRNYTQDHINLFLVIIIILFILFPLVLGCFRFNSNTKPYTSIPKLNDISKHDFSSILSKEKQALGNITINNIDFNELENELERDWGFFTYNSTYAEIWQDYNSTNLNRTHLNTKFIGTIETAIVDNLNENITDNNIITVKLNESIFVEYNDLTEGYFIYHTSLAPCDLSQLFVEYGTTIFELDAETDYFIDNDNFIVFDYEDYFQGLPNSNFILHFIWEYTLNINEWSLSQNAEKDLMIMNKEQNFTAEFNYNFLLSCKRYNNSYTIPTGSPIFIDNIYIALTINLPDKNLLNDHSLKLNNETVNINDHLNQDNSVDVLVTDLFSGDQSEFSLNFSSIFTLKFIEPVGKTWAIDRLVALNNIRERIYFPSLINGPQHIFLKYISFYEPAIYADQIISNSSLFEREFIYFHLNTSLTGRQGIKVRIPYLIVGETCPSIIKYTPSQTLRVVVTDNVKMPLIGAVVKIYYFGQEYGTYISKNRTQPITPGKTDENGEIVLSNVPAGNYTIEVYYNGIFLKESIGSTYNSRNYINTNYPHFPLWIIIFGILNGIILLFGSIFYSKYKKKR